jgi:outer membrane protein TolC
MTTAKVPGRLAATMAAVLLAGCASTAGIDSQSKLRTPESFGLQGATAPAQATSTAAVPTQWWSGFADPQLDRLVAQALADSPNLKVAQARLARARSVLEVANAATQPQLEASADLRRQRYTATGAVPPPLAGSIQESGTLQLGASWEIDFFGRYAQALEAALGSSRAAQADVDAARTLLASQVTRSYFQLARLNDQLGVAQRTLSQREESLKLVRDRVRAGLDTTLEERQGEGAIPEARQQIEALQEQVQLTRNALAALVGQPQLQV